MKHYEKVLTETVTQPVVQQIEVHPTTNSGLLLPKLQLPTLTLPEFNGEGNWPSFWDKFRSLVHDRTDISNVNKFTYLLGQLKGSAYQLVSELSVVDTNYNVAVEILKENYEDEDLILKNLVYKLLDLPGPNHNYKDLVFLDNFKLYFEGFRFRPRFSICLLAD